MNAETLRGKWNQMKGETKQKWGKLTDDDISRINGNRDELVGRIQERYGRSKEEAEREVDTWQTTHH